MYCYVCLDKEYPNNTFCDTKICNCKGTNRIHKICYSNLRFNGLNECSICKCSYRQDVKRTVIESDDYRHLVTKTYKNDQLEEIEARVSSIICCNIV